MRLFLCSFSRRQPLARIRGIMAGITCRNLPMSLYAYKKQNKDTYSIEDVGIYFYFFLKNARKHNAWNPVTGAHHHARWKEMRLNKGSQKVLLWLVASTWKGIKRKLYDEAWTKITMTGLASLLWSFYNLYGVSHKITWALKNVRL